MCMSIGCFIATLHGGPVSLEKQSNRKEFLGPIECTQHCHLNLKYPHRFLVPNSGSSGGGALEPGSKNFKKVELAGIRRSLRVDSWGYLVNLFSCSWLVVRLEVKKLRCHMLSLL